MAANQSKPTVVPADSDILCGRGKTCFEHEGNRRFRLLVANHIDAYIEAETRRKKTVVVRALINEVLESGARFLKKRPDGKWFDAGLKGAKEKVGHSLRDSSTDRIKCMTKMRKKLQKSQHKQTRSVSLSGDEDAMGYEQATSANTTNATLANKLNLEDFCAPHEVRHRRTQSQPERASALIPFKTVMQCAEQQLLEAETGTGLGFGSNIPGVVAADWDGCLSPRAVDALMTAFDGSSTKLQQSCTPQKPSGVPSSITVPSCAGSPESKSKKSKPPRRHFSDMDVCIQQNQVSADTDGPALPENDFGLLKQPGLVSISEDDRSSQDSLDDEVLSFSCDITESSLDLIPDCESLDGTDDIGLRRHYSFSAMDLLDEAHQHNQQEGPWDLTFLSCYQ